MDRIAVAVDPPPLFFNNDIGRAVVHVALGAVQSGS
jgi:hypothetical protein